MKRSFFVILTIIISLFMFRDKVDATAMYVECEYDEKNTIIGQAVGAAVETVVKHPNYIRFTTENGNARDFAINCNSLTCYLMPLTPDCWLKEGAVNFCWDRYRLDGYNASDIFKKGVCPSYITPNFGRVLGNTLQTVVPVFNIFYLNSINFQMSENKYNQAGVGKVKSKSEISRTEYVAYQINSSNGKTYAFVEGYTDEGLYAYVGPNIISLKQDDIVKHQFEMYSRYRGDFWKVHEKDEVRLPFSAELVMGEGVSGVNVCKGLTGEQCKKEHGYRVLFDSRDSNNQLKKLIGIWYEENKGLINKNNNNIYTIVNNKNLNNTAQLIDTSIKEGKSFTFEKNYSVDSFINDLEESYSSLLYAYENGIKYKDYNVDGGRIEITGSVVSKLYNDILHQETLLGLSLLKEEDTNKNYSSNRVNDSKLVTQIQSDLKKILEEFIYGEQEKLPEVNIFNLEEKLNDYTMLYFTAAKYLKANKSAYNLSDGQNTRIDNLVTNYEKLVIDEEINVFPIVDCKDLLGKDLINKINSYLDIIKIAVPILVIAFATLDFTKAIFSGEDNMKKAQQNFIKRIAIALVIFFTPMLVNLILNLANKVWPIISPNACGMFE